MGTLTRADAITQANRIALTYTDFTNNFTKSPVTNQLVILKNEDSVRQAFKNLMLTNPGEKLFNPFYGSGITGMLFENFTPFTIEDVTNQVLNTAAMFEPRVSILNVQITQDDDNNAMYVTITFSLINIPGPFTLNLPVRVR